MKTYDLLVIGSGPAGQRAAIQAAKLGKSVAVIEKRKAVGGVCLNTGTIPSKSLREAALYLSGFRQRQFYGASYSVKQDITMEDLMLRCDKVMTQEIEVVRAQLARNHVQLINGEARFLDPHRLRVCNGEGENEVFGNFIVIACGTGPVRPAHIPFDDKVIIDSDGLLSLAEVPRSMTIVGGGVVGIEYASIFAALGVKVTLIEKRSAILDFVDREIVESLVYQLRFVNNVFNYPTLGECYKVAALDGMNRLNRM